MIDDETTRFLATGCALLVGAVDADGHPIAARAWGLEAPRLPGSLRVVLDATDAVALDGLAPGAAVAVTATSVRTLRSVQLKGHLRVLEPASEADLERSRSYCEQFIDDVAATDGVDPALLARMVPPDLLVGVVDVDDEVYDQSPGPGAGAPLPDRPDGGPRP